MSNIKKLKTGESFRKTIEKLEPGFYGAAPLNYSANESLQIEKRHRWFVWYPVFIPDTGTVWLGTVERQFIIKTWPNGDKTIVTRYEEIQP